jgi:hypothetical protein
VFGYSARMIVIVVKRVDTHTRIQSALASAMTEAITKGALKRFDVLIYHTN